MFIRYVVPAWMHRESQVAIGVIAAAYELIEKDVLLRSELEAVIEWFERNLAVPDRFNRTGSKGWYRRETRGIAWLRESASEQVGRMAELAELVARCGHRVVELRTERVGYVVYEDEAQVVAEPFRDTPTK
jgi:hypothetical protein